MASTLAISREINEIKKRLKNVDKHLAIRKKAKTKKAKRGKARKRA